MYFAVSAFRRQCLRKVCLTRWGSMGSQALKISLHAWFFVDGVHSLCYLGFEVHFAFL